MWLELDLKSLSERSRQNEITISFKLIVYLNETPSRHIFYVHFDPPFAGMSFFIFYLHVNAFALYLYFYMCGFQIKFQVSERCMWKILKFASFVMYKVAELFSDEMILEYVHI